MKAGCPHDYMSHNKKTRHYLTALTPQPTFLTPATTHPAPTYILPQLILPPPTSRHNSVLPPPTSRYNSFCPHLHPTTTHSDHPSSLSSHPALPTAFSSTSCPSPPPSCIFTPGPTVPQPLPPHTHIFTPAPAVPQLLRGRRLVRHHDSTLLARPPSRLLQLQHTLTQPGHLLLQHGLGSAHLGGGRAGGRVGTQPSST